MTENTTASGAADSPKLRLLLDSFPEQNPRNFDPDAAIQLNEWGIAIVEELYRLRTLAASAPVAPTQPTRIECKVYKGSPEHREYLSARFPCDGSSKSNSFEWQGHRWAYQYTSFNDAGDYDLIWRPATPEAAPVAPTQPVVPDFKQAWDNHVAPMKEEFRTSSNQNFFAAGFNAALKAAPVAPAPQPEPDHRAVALAAGAYTTAYSMLAHAEVHNADVAGSTKRLVAAINGLRSALGPSAPVAEDAAYTELHGQINYIAAHSVDALDALDRDRLLGFARSLVWRAQTSLEIANLARAHAAQPEGGAA